MHTCILQENQKKLFHSVVQFNPGKLQDGGGSGLGLFISKSIADRHDGCLDVFSEGEGQGSTFTFTLPLYRTGSSLDQENSDRVAKTDIAPSSKYQITSTVDSNSINAVYSTITTVTRSRQTDFPANVDARLPTEPLNATTATCDNSESKFQNENPQSLLSTQPLSFVPISVKKLHVLHILVVDDSKINSKFVCKIFSKKGNWICDQAEDGQIAVDLVIEKGVGHYDVIFMDYQMPVKNGPTAIKDIRAMKYTGKIIGLTGNALQVDINIMLGAGANKVLVKPADVDELIKIVQDEEDEKN